MDIVQPVRNTGRFGRSFPDLSRVLPIWARLTDVDPSTGAYAWIQQRVLPNGMFEDILDETQLVGFIVTGGGTPTPSGYSGTLINWPAFEVNENNDVPLDSIVQLWQGSFQSEFDGYTFTGNGQEWLFEYCCEGSIVNACCDCGMKRHLQATFSAPSGGSCDCLNGFLVDLNYNDAFTRWEGNVDTGSCGVVYLRLSCESTDNNLHLFFSSDNVTFVDLGTPIFPAACSPTFLGFAGSITSPCTDFIFALVTECAVPGSPAPPPPGPPILRRGVITVTTTYTATGADSVILADATAAAFTITLPAVATVPFLVLDIKKIDATANNVTIDGNGAETIDGALTQKLKKQWDSISMVTDGAAWYIL